MVTLYREFRETETILEAYHHVVEEMQSFIEDYRRASQSH